MSNVFHPYVAQATDEDPRWGVGYTDSQVTKDEYSLFAVFLVRSDAEDYLSIAKRSAPHTLGLYRITSKGAEAVGK